MKNGWKILSIVLIILIVAYLIYFVYQKKKSENKIISKRVSSDGEWKTLTYRVPTSIDMDISGPYFWKILHNVVDEIPCGICRSDAVKRMVFFHDSVNAKLSKPLFDPKIFDEYSTKICEMRDYYKANDWKPKESK